MGLTQLAFGKHDYKVGCLNDDMSRYGLSMGYCGMLKLSFGPGVWPETASDWLRVCFPWM
jgi:hypothetical protein